MLNALHPLISKTYVPIFFIPSLVYFIINSLLNNPRCIIFQKSFMEEECPGDEIFPLCISSTVFKNLRDLKHYRFSSLCSFCFMLNIQLSVCGICYVGGCLHEGIQIARALQQLQRNESLPLEGRTKNILPSKIHSSKNTIYTRQRSSISSHKQGKRIRTRPKLYSDPRGTSGAYCTARP